MYLIDVEKVKKNAYVDKNVTTGDIQTALVLAQDIQLETLIGTALFDRIVYEVDNETISEPVQALFDGVLTKLLIYYTVGYLIHTQRIKISTQSVVKKSSDNAESISLEDINSMVDIIEGIVSRYENKLMDTLRDSYSDFPELDDEVVGGVAPETQDRSTTVFNTREIINKLQG